MRSLRCRRRRRRLLLPLLLRRVCVYVLLLLLLLLGIRLIAVPSAMQQSNNFSKPPNVKRPRLAPLPMINTGDQDVLALPSPNTRPRKKCHSNSGYGVVRTFTLVHLVYAI